MESRQEGVIFSGRRTPPPMPSPLAPDSLLSRDTVSHARLLLGKRLVHDADGGRRSGFITEVEAYDGEEDQACHARKGRTERNKVMYEAAGVWYVYLCYGMHEMLNLVTGPEGYPAAVLIRGVDDIFGPGRVTRQLGIGRALNGSPCAPGPGRLWVEDAGIVVSEDRIQASPRVGVDYAGPKWAAMPWRFRLLPEAPAAAARAASEAAARRGSPKSLRAR